MTNWVGISFRSGNHHSMREAIIMAGTQGPFVHSELLLGTGSSYKAYSAYEGIGGLLSSRNNCSKPDWTTIVFGVASPEAFSKIQNFVHHVLSLHIPYNNRDWYRYPFQRIYPFQSDLNYQRPESWDQVFCSQVILLLLRKFLTEKLIANVPERVQIAIHVTNSRGCSPNDLFRLLTKTLPGIDFQ
jgi:hypothetical protein